MMMIIIISWSFLILRDWASQARGSERYGSTWKLDAVDDDTDDDDADDDDGEDDDDGDGEYRHF